MEVLQLDFPNPPTQGRTRKRDPRTSVEAARTCAAQRQRDQIIRLLSDAEEGLTPDELGERMDPKVHRGTVASRLAQMEHDKVCEPWGVRRNGSNRNVQVWHLRPRSRWQVTVKTGEYL